MIQIAIHKATGGFTPHWIDYCNSSGISIKLVNAYDNDIISQLEDCDAFMWHHNHANYRDLLFANQLLASVESTGKIVYPNHKTGWHFDDKVGEKYLFEALNIPFAKSYVFYDKNTALDWAKNAEWPKVFKLRGGAGGQNVKLIHSFTEAKKTINKAFSQGYSAFNRIAYLKDRYSKWRAGKDPFNGVIKGVGRLFIPIKNIKLHHHQKGYVLFQDYIAGNSTDFRVKVVNGNCWAFQRIVRKNDFRASGSDNLLFDNTQIPIELITIAQLAAQKLGMQSVAFDFVYDKINNKYLIIEMSFCFGYDKREGDNGYWDINQVFHPEPFNPFKWMVDGVISQLQSSNK